MPCPCNATPPPALAGVDPDRSSTVSRDRVIYILIGIALGLYVVPRVRAKIGF